MVYALYTALSAMTALVSTRKQKMSHGHRFVQRVGRHVVAIRSTAVVPYLGTAFINMIPCRVSQLGARTRSAADRPPQNAFLKYSGANAKPLGQSDPLLALQYSVPPSERSARQITGPRSSYQALPVPLHPHGTSHVETSNIHGLRLSQFVLSRQVKEWISRQPSLDPRRGSH